MSKYRGIVTASTGNHAIGVSIAAKSYNISCVIVVPNTTPQCKKEKIRSLGSIVVEEKFNSYDQCADFAEEYAKRNKYLYVPSFDDRDMIDGHKSIFEECTKDKYFDYCFCQIGGGGLVSAAIEYKRGLGEIYGVELDTNCKMKKALEEGKIISCPVEKTICEGIVIEKVGRLPYSIADRFGLDVKIVTEEEIREAMKILYQIGIYAEGAGAASFAAALKMKEIKGNILSIITGGNIDSNKLCEIVGNSI